MPKRALAGLLLTGLLSACGPNVMTQARPYVLRSPHRSLVVFPFDYAGGRRNASPQATTSFEYKLRADGFLVANDAKTRAVYGASVLRRGAFGNLSDAAQLGAALGGKAVVVGSVDDAYDRVERRPPVWGQDARGRRILLQPAQAMRWAGIALRVRMIDSRTGAVLWSASYAGRLGGVPLSTVADQVTDVLNQQLLEAIEAAPF